MAAPADASASADSREGWATTAPAVSARPAGLRAIRSLLLSGRARAPDRISFSTARA